MNNKGKKKHLTRNVLTFVISAGVLGGLAFYEKPGLKPIAGDPIQHTITLSNSTPATISTLSYDNGTETYGNGSILFNYYQALDVSGYHTELASGGYIYNDGDTRITSIIKTYAVFTGTLSLYVGDSANLNSDSYGLTSGVDKTTPLSPYFFKIKATTTTQLTSLTITFACSELAYNYSSIWNNQFPSESAGTLAIGSPSEGDGFVLTNLGYASTFDNDDYNTPAPAPSWTFVGNGYDKHMTSQYEIEAIIRFDASTVDTAVFVIRISYSGYYDIQFRAKNTPAGWQGVQIYAGAALVAQHNNTSLGGLITDGSLTIVPEVDYIVKIQTFLDQSGAASIGKVYVNGVKVIEVGGLSKSLLDTNANVPMGVSSGTFVQADYFKCSSFTIS